MLIGQKLRELRESKHLSQGDIEQRTGLLRCYTSRVENGHTVPSIETLEKYARALEIPLCKLFHEGSGPLKNLELSREKAGALWGEKNDERRELRRFAKLLSQLDDHNRKLLMEMAARMATRNGSQRK